VDLLWLVKHTHFINISFSFRLNCNTSGAGNFVDKIIGCFSSHNVSSLNILNPTAAQYLGFDKIDRILFVSVHLVDTEILSLLPERVFKT
jgi:hypothetical protein